ncbi:MAG: hypothetical protein A2Y40_04350 [Candidatus Margulisbacteria bacterium GWF2_35_9]|nr:MAG: hypothetical protein A2Y40_04350 [Candidatus Margulisbacteria bacterium GWF2_35_9]
MNCAKVTSLLKQNKPVNIFEVEDSKCQDKLMDLDTSLDGFISDGEIPVALEALKNYDSNMRTQIQIQSAPTESTKTDDTATKTSVPITFKKTILKDNPMLTIDTAGNSVTFTGNANDCGMAQNYELQNDPAFKDKRFPSLVIKVDSFKPASNAWGEKGFKIDVNGSTIQPPAEWDGGDNFFKINKSGEITISLANIAPLGLMPNSIQVLNAGGTNLGFTVSVSFLDNGKGLNDATKPIAQPEKKVSATEFASNLNELKKTLAANTKRNHYIVPTSSMYKAANNGLLVKYADSGMIHTEGKEYTSYLLTKDATETSQKMFNQIHTASESQFNHIQNSSILSWINGEDDSAADADVFHITNLYQAYQNQKAGKWKSSELDYEALYKKANSDFLEKGVTYVKNPQGKILAALPASGTNDDPNLNNHTGSHFVKNTGSHYVFQYNQSYSYSYAASLLKDTDPRWANIVDTQNKINKLILDTYGVVDWCEVSINKTTGEISISDNLDKHFSTRYGGKSNPNPTGHHVQPRIEWPRFILDHALNYLKFKDTKSLEILNEIVKRYGSDLKGRQYNNKIYNELLYSGYRNELVVAIDTVIKVITKQLDKASLAEFKEQVLGGKDYYGNKDYNSSKHTFQQLLVATLLKGLEGTENAPE